MSRPAERAPSDDAFPFYVLAPDFDRTSAGSRVLHRLASALRAEGFDAFMVWSSAEAACEAPAEPPALDRETALAHLKSRRLPIVVRPEIYERAPFAGLDVVYILNHPGLLGGPEVLEADFFLAYSQRLAKALPRCDAVLHIPASDPAFWTPDPKLPRKGFCAYAGKYVEQHGQSLPPWLVDAKVIHRGGVDPPTPMEIRNILRRSTHCYVFENTSITAEALLCGCPVVAVLNPFFQGMLAEEEDGSWGVTLSDAPAALEAARAETARFRETYAAGMEAVAGQVQAFARAAQARMDCRQAHGFFPVLTSHVDGAARRRIEGCSRLAGEDVGFLYNLVLGREVETRARVRECTGAVPRELLDALLLSEEYRARVSDRARSGLQIDTEPTVVGSLAEVAAWAEHALAVLPTTKARLRSARNWPALHAALLSDPVAIRADDEQSTDRDELIQALTHLATRADIRGYVDERSLGRVSGWALDANAPDQPVTIEVLAEPLRLRSMTGLIRPDLKRLYGGNGGCGFSLEWSYDGAKQRATAPVEVRAGPYMTPLAG